MRGSRFMPCPMVASPIWPSRHPWACRGTVARVGRPPPPASPPLVPPVIPAWQGKAALHVLLRREGWVVNHKRIQRLYGEEGLNLRLRRPRRQVMAAPWIERADLVAANEVWSMGSVADALFVGPSVSCDDSG